MLPSICCEATQLYRIPHISLDQVAEEVHSNTKALKDLSSTIACLDKKVTSLVESHSASVAIITQTAAIALEPLTTHPDEWAERSHK